MDLKEPDGWFLQKAEHSHTGIVYRGDKHEPLPRADGAWMVQFQYKDGGGRATQGFGHSLVEAWEKAVRAVAEYERMHDL